MLFIIHVPTCSNIFLTLRRTLEYSLSSIMLTLNLLYFLNGITHLPFLELSITILGISRLGLEAGQPTVYSLVRPNRCTSWPGSIRAAKAYHFWFQQDNQTAHNEILNIKTYKHDIREQLVTSPVVYINNSLSSWSSLPIKPAIQCE